MDPLSISAGIVGFLSFIKDAVEIINDIKDASSARDAVLTKFGTLEQSLQSVKSRVDQVSNVEASVSVGAFGQKRATNQLFVRYHEAVKPGGLYAKASDRLQSLFDDEFKKALRKRDRIFWTWKKDQIRVDLDAAIELVKALRDYLHDDDVQLQQATFIELMKVRRGFDEHDTIQILNWISPSSFQPTKAMTSTVPSAADAFVKADPVYLQWLEDATSTYWHLNCFGKPGAGKSYRARAVVRDLSNRFTQANIPILSIVFNHANESQQSLRNVYRHFLRQLLAQTSVADIPDSIRQLWDRARLEGQDGPTEVQARELLVEELKKCDQKFLVADALDEATGCLQSIHSALSTLRKGSNISIFTTTRLDPIEIHDIAILCNGCGKNTHNLYWTCSQCIGSLARRIDLCKDCYVDQGRRCNDATHTMRIPPKVNIEVLPASEEIEQFVANSLKREIDMDDTDDVDDRRFSGFMPVLVSVKKALGPEWMNVPKQIAAVADDNYLIAELILKRLMVQTSVHGAKSVLKELESNISQNYDDNYKEMLHLCLNKKGREARQVAYDYLALVSCAQHVLSYQQLSHAVAVRQGDQTLEDLVDRCYTQQTVRRETNGLLTIGDFGSSEHETVFFFHRTLADFLNKHGDEWFPNRDQMMFDACLAYLNLNAFAKPFTTLRELDTVMQMYPFAAYAASFWGDHLRRIKATKSVNFVCVLEMLGDQDRKIAVTQIALHTLSTIDLAWNVQQNISPLHICALYGLADLCSILIANGEDPNGLEEGYKQTALHYACRGGHLDAARILLDAGADPNVTSDKQRTPLMEAIAGGHMDVIDLLLRNPALDVNSGAGGNRNPTALIFAAEKGQSNILGKLLEHKDIQVNKSDGWGGTALTSAVKFPNLECIKMLLKHPGVDPTIKDHRIGMPLDYIAHRVLDIEGLDEQIVTLFLEDQTQSVLGGMSLQYLIEDGRNHLVSLLLERQTFLEWRDDHGRSLMHIAATCARDVHTLRLVYDHFSASKNFDIDLPDAYGCSPLHAACSRIQTDHGSMATLLLQLGANPMLENDNRQIPVEVAFQNVSDGLSRQDALNTFRPYMEVTLDNVNMYPPLPLEKIVAWGDLDKLKAAIETEVSPLPSSPDPYTGWTLLHLAMVTQRGPRPEMLEVLLPRALPYLNDTSNTGRTCLHLAVFHKCDKGVELLLNAGAALDVKDKWGDTAFDIAQRSEESRSAFLLIHAGTAITKKDVVKDLVHRAVAAGDVDSVKRLVDIGVDIYYRKNGTGLTALNLARMLHKNAVDCAKTSIVASSKWLDFMDLATLNNEVNTDVTVKAFQEIINCFEVAQDSQNRIHKDSTQEPRQPAKLMSSSLPSLTEGSTKETSHELDSVCVPDLMGDVEMNEVSSNTWSPKDDDIASVISFEEGIETSRRTPKEKNFKILVAEIVLSREFSTHPSLRPLCEDVLMKVRRERFVQNFRRLLGNFYRTLLQECKSITEKECANLLRAQDARTHIATKIVEYLLPEDTSASNAKAEFSEQEQSGILMVERWLEHAGESQPISENAMHIHLAQLKDFATPYSGYGDVVDLKANPNPPDGDFDSLEDIEETNLVSSKLEAAVSGDINMSTTPNIDDAKKFLFNSNAFKSLLFDIQKFLIPVGLTPLCRVLSTIPTTDIQFVEIDTPKPLDRVQMAFEHITDSEWDWWPLQAPNRHLGKGNTRIRWTCHCGARLHQDLSREHALAFDNLLKLRGPVAKHDDHLCIETVQTKRSEPSLILRYWDLIIPVIAIVWFTIKTLDEINGIQIAKVLSGAVFSLLVMGFIRLQMESLVNNSVFCGNMQSDNKSPRAISVSQSHSESQKTEGPASHIDQSSSKMDSGISGSNTQDFSHGQSGATSTVENSGATGHHIIQMPQDISQSWIVLGVVGTFECFEIDHLDARPTKIENDGELFRSIRASYSSLKQTLRRWLSVWKLRHCDIIKFTKPEAYHIFRDANGPNLPPSTHQHDYQFENVGSPLTPHEFEAGLNPCSARCRLALFHQCVRQRKGTRALQRIPKKKTLWPVQEDCKPLEAWGLYAREVPSALKVTVYQIVILLGPFAFWLWWLIVQGDGDWQNASVPAAVVISLESLFWTQLGVLKLFADVAARV